MQFLIIVLIFWLYWLWTRRHLYSFAFKLPGHFGLPIIGSFLRLGGPKQHFQAFAKLFRDCKSHSICIWFGLYPALLTTEPTLIEQVLSSPDLLQKAKMYSSLDKLFGGGILTSPVSKWLHNRKLINPSFNQKVLLSFLPVFHKAKNAAIVKCDALVGKGEHKLAHLLQRISLEITIETTMGKVMKAGDQEDENLINTYSFALYAVTLQTLLAFAKLDFIITLYRPFVKAKQLLRNFVEEMVLQKLKNSSKSQSSDSTSDDSQTNLESINKSPKIFIDQAVELYRTNLFDWKDLSSESNTIIAAAFETTANALHSTLVMLAMHPEVQEKLYLEVLNTFPDKDFRMEYEHLKQLPYLDMVINESLRVAPPGALLSRQVESDLQLTDDLRLPEGLLIMIPIFNLNRRTDIWGPNADKFDPDNFLPANLESKHSHAFIPFSKGARNCIGWRYARLVLKTMIAGLIRNYRFSTTFKYEDLRYSIKVTLHFVEEPGLEIHRRAD